MRYDIDLLKATVLIKREELGRTVLRTILQWGFRLYVMSVKTHSVAAILSTLALLGVAATAHAESSIASATGVNNFGVLTIDPNHWGAPASHKSLQWEQKGRWGLKLDLDQPVDREMQLEDVRAGAFFKVTPSLRVGGAVSLSEPDSKALISKAQPPEATPRVRLETAFKF